MKYRILLPTALVLLFAAYAFFSQLDSGEVSLIISNGRVYTLEDDFPIVEAIAVRGDRIVAVGPTEEILGRFSAASMIDLQGRAAFPGFTDAHAHLEGLGAMLVNLNLAGTNSVEEIQQLVVGYLQGLPHGAWVRGRSWDQNRWPEKNFPTHQMLDEIAGDHPVYLRRVDGHAAWVNKIVLDLAGITKETIDPDGGKIIRDAEGNPTGVLIDNAMDLVSSVIPSPSIEERTAAIEKAIEMCVRYGLTQVQDMGVDLSGIDIYKKLIEADRLPLRVYAAIGGVGTTWDHYLASGPEPGGYKNKLSVRALKLYADGALGSRGAALIEPYSDAVAERGLTLNSDQVLMDATVAALENGFQVCTHAIGDRANHIVLNIYERALKSLKTNRKEARLRVEHAQVVLPSDIPRFAQLGVLPSMQPTHCTSDMYWAEDRVGPQRIVGAYAWRTFIDNGSIIPGGSDFPVEDVNPLLGFYAAITRTDKDGWPEGGWYPDQKMTREEALKSFTSWAAYAAFEEDLRGTIRRGKLADITVFTKDIMTIEPTEILNTGVELTIVGGEIVFTSGRLLPRSNVVVTR